MSLKEDIKDLREDVQDLNTTSIAMELLKDFKKANKRMFILIIILLVMYFLTILGGLYYINTIGYEETIEYAEVDNDNGDANACVGDNCSNGDINYGESSSN